jgi:hypothetical protein
MLSTVIKNFRSISELNQLLESMVKALKQDSDELSKLIGEKLRVTETTDASELQAFREKIEGGTNDPKKKKPTKRKDQKSNWHNLDAISIYDGIGLKGELELYFKALELTKSELERITKVKEAVDGLVKRGLKDELGCVFILNHALPAEIALTNTRKPKQKFTYKAIFNVPQEGSDEV